MEETLTDKDFCQTFKIDRATSLRWRELGIVSYVKLPNGAIRYRQKHIDALWANFEKMDKLGVTLKDLYRTLKGRIIGVGIPESGGDVCMTQYATNFSEGKTALNQAGCTCMPQIVESQVGDTSDLLGCGPRPFNRIGDPEDPYSRVAPGQLKEFSKKARGHKNGS